MGDEFVAVRLRVRDVGGELHVGQFQARQQAGIETLLVSDELSPMVLTSFVSEELAPLQDSHIKEVAVGVFPELAVSPEFRPLPSSLVEGQIPQAVAAEDSNSAKALSTWQWWQF